MRFMMLIKSDANAEAGVLPDEKLLSAMGEYNDQLVKAGALLAGEGLQASSKGARVHITGKKAKVTDGPFAEAKELVAGFWLIQAKSKAEAIEWAKRVPSQEGEVEVRRLYELEDFAVDPSEQPDGWRDQEQRFRDAANAAAGSSPPRQPGTKRFVLMAKADQDTEQGRPPDANILAEMGALMEEMAKKGVLLVGEGLKPTSEGARVRYAGSKRTVIDGPFTEAKELIAGFSIIQVPSKQEAVEWARRMLQIHVDWTRSKEGEIEVRQVFELEDFPVDPAEKPDGWRAHEQAFRDGGK